MATAGFDFIDLYCIDFAHFSSSYMEVQHKITEELFHYQFSLYYCTQRAIQYIQL